MSDTKKIGRLAEVAYFMGIVTLALGVALVTKSDLGLSMIAAPAYLVSQKVSFLTFGMSEYVVQAVLLLLFVLLMGKFKLFYLFSFVTTLVYGAVLDLWIWLLRDLTVVSVLGRALCFAVGFSFCTLGIAFFFRTYLPGQIYELFVMGVSKKFGFTMTKCKIVFDISFLVLSLVMTFLLFGRLEGIGIGTLLSAFLNGVMINFFGKILDRFFDFSPALPLSKYFTLE